MYLDNEFYSLKLRKKDFFQNSLRKSGHANTIQWYFHHFWRLGLRDDERIEYVSGKQSILELKKNNDEGKFAVGFILFLLISMKLKLWRMLI
jgi:uncharacterized protein (DUF1015 family)